MVEPEVEKVIVHIDSESFHLGYPPDELEVNESAAGEFADTVIASMGAAIVDDGRQILKIAAAAEVSAVGLTSVLAGRVAPSFMRWSW